MLTVEEIANILNVSEETVRRWLRDGKLTGKWSSKKTGYEIESKDFEQFLALNRRYSKRKTMSETKKNVGNTAEIRKSLAIIKNELNKIYQLLGES